MADEVNQTDEAVDQSSQAPEAGPASAVAAADVEAEPVGEVQAEPAGDEQVADSGSEQDSLEEVAFSWQASEYVHHVKSGGWYVGLAGVVVLLSGVAALLRSWLSIALFVVMGAAILVYAKRPPRTLTYELSEKGIRIEGREYPYEEFRAFSVMPDEEWHAIEMESAKRFMPSLTVLFDTEDFDSIVGHLELHLPRADREMNMVEKATRYLRF